MLGKWKERKMLGRDTMGKGILAVDHLSHQKSFFKALTIVRNNPLLLIFTKREMMHKFPAQSKLLILFNCTSIMVRIFYPLSVGVTCGKFRVLQCQRVLEISETAAGGSVRLTLSHLVPYTRLHIILYDLQDCTASNDSNAAADVELVTPETCSQKLVR
jgi:hypothetical protein